MIFRHFFKRRSQDKSISALYTAIMAQSRLPVFYQRFAVPDTLDGRFELLAIHSYLVLHRLWREEGEGSQTGQKLADHIIQELDRSLRESGIADLGVPRRIKTMAKALRGRASAYDEAMKQGNDALENALSRNIYPSVEPPQELAGLAEYMRIAITHLQKLNPRDVANGNISFPTP